MCFEYNNEIYEGETWTATVVPIDPSSPEDLELAYLFSVASTSINRQLSQTRSGQLGSCSIPADRARRREPDRRECFG